ncbi:Alpha/Beta hydrolase protein [Podospora didyma]|uniref:Alpha/Beta hydrolase protein n=1 Tax=Podospora didyma TaxID=330526 RepID=A0AAE0NNV6_9PEZI|nr:Alpha/Beta hydrolase protein [Podospora didyma]
MAGIKWDTEFGKILEAFGSQPRPQAEDALTLRGIVAASLGALYSFRPAPEGVDETSFSFPAKDGSTLTMYRFTPHGAKTTEAPALLYVHGGGMVAGSVELFKKSIMEIASKTGISVFAPAYRLAPEHPFPTPVDDVYAALEHLQDRSGELGVDPKRVGVWGASAGGGIAAGVALMARDKALTPPIAKLHLIYPMLDDRTNIAPENPLSKFLVWTQKDDNIGWGAYLGAERTNVSPYAVPARATDVSGLPPTYIDTGNLDLFRDEILEFAAKLAKANVDVELHVYRGVPHGWEIVAPDLAVTKSAVHNRAWALREL